MSTIIGAAGQAVINGYASPGANQAAGAGGVIGAGGSDAAFFDIRFP